MGKTLSKINEGYSPKGEVKEKQDVRTKTKERNQKDAEDATENVVAQFQEKYGNAGPAKPNENPLVLDSDDPLEGI